MEATTLNRTKVQRLLGTRRGTLAVAGVCAILAAAVLVVFLSKYRESGAGAAAPTPVLVARALIEKGTSGDTLAEQRQFEVVNRPAADVKQGAVSDPAAIAGKIAVADVYPGQQITASSFKASTGTVLPKLAEDQRAIAVPVDAAHGLVGQVQTGDQVDVLASYTATNMATGQGASIVKTIVQGALVLRAGGAKMDGAAEQATEESIVLRVTDRKAAEIAHVADNGKVWVTLRPGGKVKQADAPAASYSSVIGGTKGAGLGFKATIKQEGNTVTVEGEAK